jgi:hypothetical protein
MIKIMSFYPLRNLGKVTQEFYDDKAVITSKSLNYEGQSEFSYSDVGEINYNFHSHTEERLFGFFTIFLSSLISSLFWEWLYNHTFWLKVVQIAFLGGTVIYIVSYIKHWYVRIINKNGVFLTGFWENRRNKNLILDAIEKIKAKSVDVEETSSADPFPTSSPVFEHSYFTFSSIENTDDKFYDEKIIGLQKGIYREQSYKIKYDDLSGKIHRGKESDGFQWTAFEWCFLILLTISTLRLSFGVQFGESRLYVIYALGIIVAASWLLAFIKREVFGFYNKTGQIEYWAYVNRRDKEKVEKIIEFVKSRIPAETTAEEQ